MVINGSYGGHDYVTLWQLWGQDYDNVTIVLGAMTVIM